LTISFNSVRNRIEKTHKGVKDLLTLWNDLVVGTGFELATFRLSEPRRIYFDDVLWEIFQKASKIRSLCHDFVFTYKGRPINDIGGGFEEALRRAKIENFWFHDMRRTLSTNMRKAKVDQTVIMKLTGHKTPSMFNRYNTVDQEDAIDAMKRLKSLLV